MRTIMPVTAELDPKGERIHVNWTKEEFSTKLFQMKTVAGRRFLNPETGWSVPKDMDTCRQLRKAFGSDLVIGPQLRRWAQDAVSTERNLGSLAAAETAELERLPEILPSLYRAIHVGPLGANMSEAEREQILRNSPPSFQAADVKFMATAKGPLNANEMGTGKTIELIAAVFESGLDKGPHLVMCPLVSMNSVWKKELDKWQPYPVLVATGTNAKRLATIKEALRLNNRGEPFWLIINPQMTTPRKDPLDESKWYLKPAKPKEEDARACCFCDARQDGHHHYKARFPELYCIHWNTITLDEAHRAAVGNNKALTYIGMKKLTTEKKFILTGTPMGGKPIKLFPILQLLNPDTFTSKWNWAERWLEITDNGYGKRIGGIRPEVKQEFYKSLMPYVIRRTKAEVVSWLPPKQYINHWVEMEGTQLAQYAKWNRDVSIKIDELELQGTAVLDQYTRLRQFAICSWEGKEGMLSPLPQSCKLEALEQILTELGIIHDKDEPASEEQIVIFSQFTKVVDMAAKWLRERGVEVGVISGQVNQSDRDQLQADFQSSKFQAMVMNVKAGGVSIQLDRASNVVFLDETWNPDDQTQAEDRCHRASRIHQVTVHYIRTRGTIEELVFDEVTGKQEVNVDVLDERRKQLTG
jgi:SNF2 family DNA or RNA helicase